MTTTIEPRIGKVVRSLRWKNGEVSPGQKIGRSSLAKGLQSPNQKTDVLVILLPKLQRWMADSSASLDRLEEWHKTVRRALYSGEPDAMDDYAACYSQYTRWLAKATAQVPAALLYACKKRFGFVKGADDFYARIHKAAHLIATWVDPSQVVSLSGRNWEMTEEEAKEVSEMLSD